ncbi:hypothetical protein BJ165DRAFT_1521750 [Panaeolus papilionaceus]|nr:hypothetical protein BJ165DRAFT_1521750 [Panaeolus papilionaceus]
MSNATAIHREFLRRHHEHSKTRMRSRAQHVPSVARFEVAIKADPVMVFLFDLVFLQAAKVPDVPADAFFVREFQPGARPILEPDNPTIIHNACESTILCISRDVQLHDQFWLKPEEQPYSLYDTLDRNAEDAAQFVGGTESHQHSGTYYAALPDDGASADDPDLKPGDPQGALVRSQPWLTLSSARSLIFIEADNPNIGMMCFVGIGMGEVSTCENTVKPGDRVVTGQQIGIFHFGGSSHAMIFGPQAKITFADVVETDTFISTLFWLRFNNEYTTSYPFSNSLRHF